MQVDKMNKFTFYYDESEHSRKINHSTITAGNYADCFVAVIVGWDDSNQSLLDKKYKDFEFKHKARLSDGEIKSTTIAPKQLIKGFASLGKDNVQLLEDYFDLFDESVHAYYSVFSKIEYIVHQIFINYENSYLNDMDLLKYSITKAIVTYKPSKILLGMYNDTGELVKLLVEFFHSQIKIDKTNEKLKQREIDTFKQILAILDTVSEVKTIDWNYDIAFDGFKKYLHEQKINNYSIIIDKEGDGKTVNAAKQIGITNVSESNSKSFFGIRMADMLAGIISKLIKALSVELLGGNTETTPQKRVLDAEWFNLSERHFLLYKKLYMIMIELNTSLHKSFAGIYSDGLISLISLLKYMSRFNNPQEIIQGLHKRGEYLNGFICKALKEYFERLHDSRKIPPPKIDFVSDDDINNGFFINQRGAKCFIDSKKQLLLQIADGESVFDVLSVGVDKELIPTITLRENDDAVCYRLPYELQEWVVTLVGFATMNDHVFPSKVMFTKKGNKYFVDLL